MVAHTDTDTHTHTHTHTQRERERERERERDAFSKCCLSKTTEREGTEGNKQVSVFGI